MNFLDHIKNNSVSYPETTAISYGKTSITYWDLYMQIRNVAGSARKAGIKSDSNVLFACKPDVESLTLALGLLYSGASLTILDPFSSNELFISRGVKAGVTHVVADPILYRISKHRNFTEKLLKKPVADIFGLGVPTFSLGKYRDIENIKPWFRKREYKENFDTKNREAIIVFTSGTTSEPKGVVHTLESLSANIDDFIDIFNIEDGQKIYSEPITLGLIALSAGATWIIPKNEKRIPDCDVWFGTPAEILAGLPKSRRSKISIISSGSAPVLPSLVKQIQKHHRKSRILCVYGMTEMLPIAVGDATKKLNFADGDYIGEPLPKSEVEIIDGEVYVGGPALMDHYVGHEPTGMLLTGDYGKILSSGELVLLGRKKDMFIRGDMNVYPALYEPNVSTIEGVNEVVLIGLPDKYGDDKLVLVVSPKHKVSHRKLKREVSKRMFKFFDEKAIPSKVIVLDNIPKSGRANKIDRKATTALITKMKENGSW